MWTARILLIATEILLCGGWFDKATEKRQKRGLLLGLPAVLALSFMPDLNETYVHACAAPCAMLLFLILLCPTAHPFGAAIGAALGGIVGWKLWDRFPLFPELGLLTSVPTLLFSVFYCRDRNAKALAIAAAPFVTLLMRAVGDYTLFQSTVLEIGNGDALCAQSSGLLLLLLLFAVLARLPERYRHASDRPHFISRMRSPAR